MIHIPLKMCNSNTNQFIIIFNFIRCLEWLRRLHVLEMKEFLTRWSALFVYDSIRSNINRITWNLMAYKHNEQKWKNKMKIIRMGMLLLSLMNKIIVCYRLVLVCMCAFNFCMIAFKRNEVIGIIVTSRFSGAIKLILKS